MLYYNKIKLSERTDVAKSNNSKECMIVTIDILITGLIFKILFVMVVMIS